MCVQSNRYRPSPRRWRSTTQLPRARQGLLRRRRPRVPDHDEHLPRHRSSYASTSQTDSSLSARFAAGSDLQHLAASEEWDRSAALAQRAIDAGARTDAVSRAMRRDSTKTTEAYCARLRVDHAFGEIERAFARPVFESVQVVRCAQDPGSASVLWVERILPSELGPWGRHRSMPRLIPGSGPALRVASPKLVRPQGRAPSCCAKHVDRHLHISC